MGRLQGTAIAITVLTGMIVASSCSTSPDTRIEIRYMAWGNPEQLAVEQKACNEFMKANPDIKVKLFQVPGSAYTNKMMIMMASHTAPDIMRVDHYNFPDYVRKGYFYDLSKFIEKDPSFDLTDFYPQAIEEGTFKGRIFGLNVLNGGAIMYYNKTMIKNAGLEDPYELQKRGEWTWDTARDYAIKLTQRGTDGRAKQFGMALPSFTELFPVIWAFGGEILTPDYKKCLLGGEGSVKAVQFLSDLRWKDKVAPTPQDSALSAFTFESGQIGMVFGYMGNAPRYRSAIKNFEWDICPMPKGPFGDKTTLKGNQLVIYSESKHPDAAWRFAKFLTSPEQELFIQGELRRACPTRKSVAHSERYLHADKAPFNTLVYLSALENGRPVPINERWNEWTTVAKMQLDKVWIDPKADIGGILRETANKVDEVLNSEEGF